MFKVAHIQDISLKQWIARMPDKMAEAHLKLSAAIVRQAPQTEEGVIYRASASFAKRA
jgi:oxalate decarboxylase